jgi:hypothetical protein
VTERCAARAAEEAGYEMARGGVPGPRNYSGHHPGGRSPDGSRAWCWQKRPISPVIRITYALAEQREPKPGLDRRGGWPIASSASSEPAPRLCPPQDFAAQCAPMPVAPPCWTSAVSSD